MSKRGLQISTMKKGVVRSGRRGFSYWYINEGGKCITITRHSSRNASVFFVIPSKLTAEQIADGDDCFLGNNFTDTFDEALGIAVEMTAERAA